VFCNAPHPAHCPIASILVWLAGLAGTGLAGDFREPTLPLPNTTPRKVLLVEDEAIVAASLGLILSSRGYDVRAVDSAERAIELLATWEPQLAIIDVMLPQMNGIELAALLQGHHPSCRVLLISGHPGAAELLNEARARGNSFEILAKPLHPAFLLDIVSRIWGDGGPATA